MSKSMFDLTQLYPYILENSVRNTELLRQLREETSKDELARMQIAPEQGQLMALLAKLIGAKRALEVGTFTGYSSLSVGLALPEDGELICCDVSEKWTNVAKRYWQAANISQKIKLILAPAVTTLNNLLAEGKYNYFDFIFIDADKENYDQYYELGLKLLRPNGLMLLDNMLWAGRVIDAAYADDIDTQAIVALNKKLHTDERIDISLIPVADGISVIRKR